MKRSSTAAAAEQNNNKKLKNGLKKAFATSVDTALVLQLYYNWLEKEKSWQERADIQMTEKKALNTALN